MPDNAGRTAAKCVWTGRAQPISSAASARRTGNEMVCTGSANDGDRSERRTPRRLDARRDCCALAQALNGTSGWSTGLGHLRGRIRSAGAVRGGAEGVASAAVSGKSELCRKKHAETMACAGFGAMRARLPRCRLTRDNCCYRESIAKFRRFRRLARKACPVASGLCRALPSAIQPVGSTAVSYSRDVKSAPSAPPAPEGRACAGRRI